MDVTTLNTMRASLEAARATGARIVRHGDKEVTYRSEAEIAAAIAAIDRDIASIQGRRVHTFLPTFSKGLGS